VLTAVTVAAILMVAQMFGRRIAGVIAGLPLISAPAFIWVAMEQGHAFASQTASGAVAACALMAIFWLAFERVSRSSNAFFALVVSLGVVATLARWISGAEFPLWFTFATALVVCALALKLLPEPSAAKTPTTCSRRTLVLTAVVAGGISAVVSTCASELGSYWSGMVASLPVSSACVVIHQRITATHHDVRHFLRGYMAGLIGKVCFSAMFSFAILRCDAHVALVLAIVVTVTAFALANNINRRRVRRRLMVDRRASIYAATR
jgi:hypothetical protein